MPLEFEASQSARDTVNIPQVVTEVLTQENKAHLEAITEEFALKCRELSVVARRRRRVYLRWQAALSLSLIVWLFGGVLSVYFMICGYSWDTAPVMTWFLLFLILSLIGIGGYLRLTHLSKSLRRLFEIVISEDSTRAAGALIDTLSIDDTSVAREARRQLARLAPRWKDDDLAALTSEQRDGLRRIIDGVQTARHGDAAGVATGRRHNGAERVELRVAVCSALGRLGNNEDLQLLRRVSSSPRFKLLRPVCEAATAAVRELEARLDEKNRPHTLLRASMAPSARPDELVRAAGALGVTDSEQLLRPDLTERETEDRMERRLSETYSSLGC